MVRNTRMQKVDTEAFHSYISSTGCVRVLLTCRRGCRRRGSWKHCGRNQRHHRRGSRSNCFGNRQEHDTPRTRSICCRGGEGQSNQQAQEVLEEEGWQQHQQTRSKIEPLHIAPSLHATRARKRQHAEGSCAYPAMAFKPPQAIKTA